MKTSQEEFKILDYCIDDNLGFGVIVLVWGDVLTFSPLVKKGQKIKDYKFEKNGSLVGSGGIVTLKKARI